MNSFKIGGTEFGVGDVWFSGRGGEISLEIEGDRQVLRKLTENGGEWGWALYPPKICLYGLPRAEETKIDRAALEKYDIGLYIMEHMDFTGRLKVTRHSIEITGQTRIYGDILPIDIKVDR